MSTTPLTLLLPKNNKFTWGESQDKAFQTLKTAFTTAPILQHFQPGLPIVIETDASDYALAGILSHMIEGKLYPVAFYCRKLSDPELNYEIYDKEMLAIVEAFKHWRAYLEGSADILVYTYHKNLQYFTTTKVLNRRQARWAELLAHFDFKIVYRPGKQMGKPDALTRHQDLQGGSKAAESPPRTLLKPHQIIISALDSSPSSPPEVPETPENISDLQSDILGKIKTLQQEDPALSNIIPALQDPTLPRSPELSEKLEPFHMFDNMVWYANLLYIPDNQDLKIELLQQVHNSPTAGHLGQAKTKDLLTRNYYFPSLAKFVKTYVNGCHTCARNKSPRHKQHGPLQPLPIPSQPWKSISMDAIIKLPLSNGYDSIQVFVDCLTKQAHFVPYTEKGFDAPDLAKMFLHNII